MKGSEVGALSLSIWSVITEYQFVNNRHLFLSVLKTESPILRHQQIQCLVKTCFLV